MWVRNHIVIKVLGILSIFVWGFIIAFKDGGRVKRKPSKVTIKAVIFNVKGKGLEYKGIT